MQAIEESHDTLIVTAGTLEAHARAGYGVLLLPPGAKGPPPDGLTGAGGRDLTAEEIDRDYPHGHRGNLAVRLPRGVVGIDVDAYDGKRGGETWDRLHALGRDAGTPIPDTVRITSRGETDAVSGIRVYRADLPQGRKWRNGLPGIETIHHGHRYAVCSPSIHPEGRPYLTRDEAMGFIYVNLPAVNSLPWLPAVVINELTQDTEPSRPTAPAVSTDEVQGDAARGNDNPCNAVRDAAAKARTGLSVGGSRHDATVRNVLNIARLHERGHTGALCALDEVRSAFVLAVTTGQGMKRTPSEAEREYASALTSAWERVAASPTPHKDRGCCGDKRSPISPWTPPGNPARALTDVLNEVHAFLRDYVVFPSEETATATTLWVAQAHALQEFDSTPRLAFLSPEPGSGKSRALEVIATLVPRPMHAVNATPAALFRSVGDDGQTPTILFDEIDTIFGSKTADGHEDVRGFINAGHRRGAVAYRCVGMGTNQTVQAFPAFCAMALAGLNDLPDTIATRSIIVAMRKRAPHERVKPWRTRNEPHGHALRDALGDTLVPHLDALTHAEPVMPEGVEDRPADVWEPLLAIADAAGGQWPQTARSAAVFLTLGRHTEPSRGVQLLAALHTIWQESGTPEHLTTADVLAALNSREEEPWPGMRGGQGIDARGLATLLGKYEVRSKTVRVGESTLKGYAVEHLHDPWARYCSLSPERGNKRHTSNSPGGSVETPRSNAASDPSHHTDPSHTAEVSMGDVTAVTDVTHPRGTDIELLCATCGEVMDTALPDMGFTSHPNCTEDEG